ncbi:hypothetical protein BvRS1_22780 [Burkholderia vietnamiensis]|nr:hypothetical protein BvRS1_22780 [Burkholderia vietnamiensis]
MLDLQADGRLRQVQLHGGAREIAFTGDRRERAQQSEIHRRDMSAAYNAVQHNSLDRQRAAGVRCNDRVAPRRTMLKKARGTPRAAHNNSGDTS